MDDTMIVDCDRCQVRGNACSDCVISVLLGAPPEVEWDDDEQRAVDALVDGGMVPRLRLVPTGGSALATADRVIRRAG
ncbi:hypothetical protein SAMN05216266_10977 [Amycolatopsis marina]|uniref:Uncharacterized protein n=1 Tax=Amycolatopsis marina TaxID=490629 RepID=A0A1I1AJL2_9PSEU|nr:hypothetical protein [Amycolatopsis marina]SFB36533.1 hypothetical protein SAMN05216266_10977 [Amycolatopsis marina]